MKTKVELRSAYAWTCEECGRDNFHNGIVAEMSPEDEREFREEMGIEFMPGEWIMRPEAVKCQHCGEEFEVECINDDEMDDL